MKILTRLLLLLGITACGPVDKVPVPPGEGAVRLGTVLGSQEDDAAFERATVQRTFVFPEDHGAHRNFRSEWWYLTLVLEDADERTYGAQFTLFRQAIRPPSNAVSDNPWDLTHVWLAHFAMTDVDGAEHVAFERWSRDHPQLAGVKRGGDNVEAFLDDWSLHINTPGAHLAAASGDWQIELDLAASQPLIPQGDAGLSRKSAGQASYYYSWPRLEATGTLVAHGETYVVKGLGWLDHEWSTSVLAEGQMGWAWFALHLDDGRSVMAFRLRRRDGSRDPFDHGVMVQADGSYQPLHAADFQLEPDLKWRDPDGTEWPVGWVLDIGNESWVLRAAVEDQRMHTRIPYWEGVVYMQEKNGNRIGSGFMELTGF